MGVEGCAKLAKLLLFIVNFIIFLAGSACLAIGVYFLADTSYTDIIQPYLEMIDLTILESLIYVVLVVGVFLFLIGFLGCYGAMKESKFLLVLYSVLILVLLLAQVSIVVVAFVARSWATSQLDVLMENVMDEYAGFNATDEVSLIWNILQSQYKCCGVNNYSDWENTAWALSSSYHWPLTCCVFADNSLAAIQDATFDITATEVANCYTNTVTPNETYVYTEGCLTQLLGMVETYLMIAGCVTLGIIGFQFILLASACCIINRPNDD